MSFQPDHPKFGTLLVLSILMTCCCNWFLGIPAIVLVCLANSDYKKGLLDKAEGKMKAAKICLIVGLVMIALLFVVAFISGFLSMILSGL